MTTATPSARTQVYPAPRAVLELLKPITWFPPMWAFACGVVSSGVQSVDNWMTALLGVILAGPLVCAMSETIHDWYDPMSMPSTSRPSDLPDPADGT